jgi:hypothetical protein
MLKIKPDFILRQAQDRNSKIQISKGINATLKGVGDEN